MARFRLCRTLTGLHGISGCLLLLSFILPEFRRRTDNASSVGKLLVVGEVPDFRDALRGQHAEIGCLSNVRDISVWVEYLLPMRSSLGHT